MKNKIIMLLSLLLLCGTRTNAFAGEKLTMDGASSSVYLLRNLNDNKVITAKGSTDGSLFNTTDYSAGNAMQVWQMVTIVENDEEKSVKLYNIGSGLFISNITVTTPGKQGGTLYGTSDSEDAGIYTIGTQTGTVFACTALDVENSRYLHCNDGDLIGWGRYAGASQWEIVELDEVDYECFYNQQDTPFFTAPIWVLPGENYLPQFDWVRATTENVETPEGESNITKQVYYVFDDNSNCPVKNSANGEYKWNLITLPDNDTPWNVRLNQNGATFSSQGVAGQFDNLSWFAFELENPANSAFRIYSRSVDSEGQYKKVGANPAAPSTASTKGDMLWSLSANGDNWSLRKAHLATDDNANALDNGWWSQSKNQNNQPTNGFSYGATASPLKFVSEEAFLAEYITPYQVRASLADLPEDEYLGLPNYEKAVEIADIYDNSGLSENLYNEKIAKAPIKDATVEAGKYYRIVNTVSRSDIGTPYAMLGVENGVDNTNPDTKYIKGKASSSADAGLVWFFEATDNGFALYNPSTESYLAQVRGGNNSPQTPMGEKTSYSAHYNGNGDFFIHLSGATVGSTSNPERQKFLNMENSYYISGWDGENAHWYIAEATTLDVELKENESRDYWTSIFLPFAVEVGEGVTNIYGAKDNGSSLKLNQVDGQTLAARQGALLNGSAAQVTLSILSGAAATAAQTLSENDLTGYTQDKPRGERTVYALSKQDGILAFYKYTGDTLPAYKAYIVTDSENAETLTAKYFDFGTVTGIDAAPTTSENTAADVYDLSGRRVSHAGKGLYIVGGRKVIR